MTVNRKPTGTALSMPMGLAWGALVSVGITLGGAALTAKLIDSEIIDWKHSGYAVLIILLLSTWIGALVAIKKTKRLRMITCLASGVVYFGILLAVTALFFGGQYSGVGETGLLIFCGSMLGGFAGHGGKKPRKNRKTGFRNC